MEGYILFMYGADFFDVRKNTKERYKEISVFEENLFYEKEEDYYFTDIDKKNEKIYDFDSSELVPTVRKHGKFYYVFLATKGNEKHTPYVLFHKGRPLALTNFTFIVEEYLLPKFGINYYYYDCENEINKKMFLIRQ